MLIPTSPWCMEKNGLEIFFCITRSWALISQWDERNKVHEEQKLMKCLGVSQSPPAILCGLGQRLEGERALWELLPQDSRCTCWERSTLSSRHDVGTRRVVLKKTSCLTPLTVLWFASWSSLRVYELHSF